MAIGSIPVSELKLTTEDTEDTESSVWKAALWGALFCVGVFCVFRGLNLIQNEALCSKRDTARHQEMAKNFQIRFEQSAEQGHLYVHQPPSDLPEVGGKLKSRWHEARLRL
jgi:hypothetical protein